MNFDSKQIKEKKALMIAQKVFEQPDTVQFWRFMQQMDLSF